MDAPASPAPEQAPGPGPIPPVAFPVQVDPLAQTAPAGSGVSPVAPPRAGCSPVGGTAEPTRPGLGVSPTAPGEARSSGPLSYERRFTICVTCTAPVQVPAAGGTVACARCNTHNAVVPRDDSADRAAAMAPATMSNAQRFETLRAQDGKPVMPPPALAHFMQGELSGARLEQCWQAWLAARSEMRTMPGFPVQERLYFLGMFLYGALSTTDGAERVRALLETTRDAVTEPRFRQQMHGMLARVAAREGDVAAAEQWLALCTPHSGDLHMDTAWRITRAYVSTKQRDWVAVLRTLGYRPEDVPISDNYDEMATVFRANALEQQGQVDEAALQLARAGGGEAKVTGIIQANGALGPLCPQSLLRMREAAARAAANMIRTKSGAGLGFLGVGIPLLVLGSIGFALAGEFLFEGEVGGIVAGVGITLITFVFLGGLFGGMAMASAKKAKLAQTGARGVAQLTMVRQTGTRVNDQPLLELTMNVNLPGMEPYTAIHREVVAEIRLAQVQPGAMLQVAVDPKDRRFMAILWQ